VSMQFSVETEQLISELRGLPHDDSRRIDSGSAKLDSVIEVILKQYRIGEKTPQQVLMENWREVIGQSHAHRCSPLRIVNHTQLVVQVSNAVLRQELQFKERQILKKIQTLEGCQNIRQLRLV
jgi:hypothetical protein